MKILIESRAFYPSIGGLEMMAEELATKWQDSGHSVRVSTVTPLEGHDEYPGLKVTRNPAIGDWARHMKWADVFVQNGISLRSLLYPIVTKTPIIFCHQNLLTADKKKVDVLNALKQLATYLGHNVAICQAVADTIPGPKTIVPNTFRPVFDRDGKPDAEREGLLLVGRLVSVKGVDVALDALHLLHERGYKLPLTICGDGPDRDMLEQKAATLGLDDYVTFAGWTGPEELAEQYARAAVTLIPSRYEPFGIVALEAIACGSPVVASAVDGLPESVGNCGVLVEPENPEALASGIEKALTPSVRDELREAMPAHVDRHRIDCVADAYLEVIERYVEKVA